MTRILHVSRRPLNGHPCWLSELQNRNGWQAKTCLVQEKETGKRPYPCDIKTTDRSGLKEWTSECNVVHFHGDMTLADPLGAWLKQWFNPRVQVIQHHYHERSLLEYKVRMRKIEAFETEIMAARKGALLDPGLPLVPVVVPTWRSEMAPVVRRRERLKLVFTPTSQDRLMNYRGSKGKGYHETKAILDKIKGIDSQIITDLNWKETMLACREADIRLDEVVTGGYGMASLEGLATGCLTVGGCTPEVMAMLGAPPYFHAEIENLERTIDKICSISWENRHDMQMQGIKWMMDRHNEKMMFEAYKGIYENCALKAGFSKEEIRQEYNKKVYSCTITELKDIPQPEIMPNKGGKLIVQVSRTNCAGAIWHIHNAINKYTPHTCRTITESNTTNGRRFPKDILLSDGNVVLNILSRADVVHFHNRIDHDAPDLRKYKNHLDKKKKVLQYHTEPQLLQRAFQKDLVTRTDLKTLTIAQKHARFYPNSFIVPNIIDIHDPVMNPSNRYWFDGKLKVIYTPSDKKSYPDYSNTCCGKGYDQVMAVLKRLEDEGLIEATVISDLTWEELMPIKRQHDICIDECVTGGYHLCSLEALSQGLITIAWLDDKTKEAIKDVTGNDEELPWVNTKQAGLYDAIKGIASSTPENVDWMKKNSRRWMEKNWDPKKLIERFMEAYEIKEQRPAEGHVNRKWGFNNLLSIYNGDTKLNDSVFGLEKKWKDKQVIIWGNGHTVAEAMAQKDEKWFKDSVHIGTNAAVLLGLKFNAYCVGDLRFIKDPAKKKMAVDASGVKIFQSFLKNYIQRGVQASYVKTLGNSGFCSDLRIGVYHGYSVAWLALQVAVWGGAKEILLAGCPHDYSGKPRFYDEKNPAPIDNSLQFILKNYSTVIPIFQSMGVRVRTIGKSRLNSAGVEEMLTPGIY